MCYFIIDGENYLIDAQESQWSIGKMSHTLVTDIIVESTDIERIKTAKRTLISEKMVWNIVWIFLAR